MDIIECEHEVVEFQSIRYGWKTETGYFCVDCDEQVDIIPDDSPYDTRAEANE